VKSEVYRYLACGDVGDHLGNEERIELRTVLLVHAIVFHLVLKRLDTSDTHAEYHANACLVDRVEVNLAVFHRLNGRHESQLCVAIHLAHFLAVDVFGKIEVLDFATELCLELRSVKQCDGRGSADSVYKVVPCLLGVVAHRGNGSQTRHDYSF
jgi:hypothetical protein